VRGSCLPTTCPESSRVTDLLRPKTVPEAFPIKASGKPYLTGLGKSRPLSAHDQQTLCNISSLIWRFHIRVRLLRRFTELPVFDARLYIRVRRIDEVA
jgi:hypothetical protein